MNEFVCLCNGINVFITGSYIALEALKQPAWIDE